MRVLILSKIPIVERHLSPAENQEKFLREEQFSQGINLMEPTNAGN